MFENVKWPAKKQSESPKKEEHKLERKQESPKPHPPKVSHEECELKLKSS